MTPEQRKQLEEIFARGLTAGVGSTTGQTCIEGALSLVFDGELGDRPSCVASPDRAWAIRINDAAWPSPEARAKALLPIALAQVGTQGTDRTAWVQAVALGTIQRVLPIALEAVGLVDEAKACRESTDLTLARAAAAAYNAYNAAYYADRADRAARTAAAANAAAYAANAAYAAAYAVGPADATRAATAAADAATNAAYATYATDVAAEVLEVAVAVALDAYAQEGR